MEIIDISWPLRADMTGYKNKKEFSHTQTNTGKIVESVFQIGSHAGTHVDAPLHMMPQGTDSSHIYLNTLVGQCLVIDMTDIDVIRAEDIEPFLTIPPKIILFKTRNSEKQYNEPFDPQFVYLAEDAAVLLSKKNITTIGIDYLGIERNQANHPSHHTLMQHSITIIEGLRLHQVEAGEYFFVCLPLAIAADASPARAILLAKQNIPFFL